MNDAITQSMRIADIIREHPQTLRVFQRFKLDCAWCGISTLEQLARGAAVHGVDLQALVAELNRVASSN